MAPEARWSSVPSSDSVRQTSPLREGGKEGRRFCEEQHFPFLDPEPGPRLLKGSGSFQPYLEPEEMEIRQYFHIYGNLTCDVSNTESSTIVISNPLFSGVSLTKVLLRLFMI